MTEQVNAVDRIGCLPDDVLRHILSFLPTKTALRTSILSTRWRYLFPFSNNLDFDDLLVFKPLRYYQSQNDQTAHFSDFVGRCIMLMNVTRVDKFCLRCGRGVDTSRVNSWLSAALLRNVRELDLWLIPLREFREQPLFVYTCSTLVVLKLGGRFFSLYVPDLVYLPCLKSLSLYSAKFPDEVSTQRLFSGCPVIEDLEIKDCYKFKIWLLNLSNPSLKRLTLDNTFLGLFKLVLDAPSLMYLNYTMCEEEDYVFKNLHSLSEVHISFSHRCDEGPVALSRFLKGIGSAQTLFLSDEYGFLSDENGVLFDPDWDRLPLLEKLTRLVLSCDPFIKMSWVMKLLRCTPNLEEFLFNVRNMTYLGGLRDTHEDECADVPACVSSRLNLINYRTLSYYDKPCIEKDLESIEYLLKTANVLEKMWMYLGCERFGKEGAEKMKVETIKNKGRMKACEVKFFRALNRRCDDWVEF